MSIDNAVNFGKVTVLAGHNASDTSIALQSGNGALLPVAPFNVVYWNFTDFADPSDDPNKEICRVTAGGGGGGGDTLTVTRGVEGTAGSTKNTAGKTYKMIAGLTAKVINTDLITPAAPTSITLANGLNSNISLAAVPVGAGGGMSIRATGPTGAYSLGGFTGGLDGRELYFFNPLAQTVTVVQEDASSTAANRIQCNGGSSIVLNTTKNSSALFRYDAGISRWVVVSTS